MKNLLLLFGLAAALTAAELRNTLPDSRPVASVNLMTSEGASLVQAEWRYSNTKIVEVDFTGPGADGQPPGKPVKTYDYTPHAGGFDFDDSRWEQISTMSLEQRRSTGRLCFNWYRTRITIPEKIGDFSTLGSTVVFETSLDDYAEIWVDGELTRAVGQRGGSVIAGWNASNRLVIGRDVKPGQKIRLAIFGANGPLSNPPTNFIWMPGSNGLTLDQQGRLTINEHGNRRVTRLEKDGGLTVLADRYEGKRLNSPNDLVYRSDGTLYFTDPPFGLPKFFDDPRKELPYSGVFSLRNGKLQLITTDFKGPNGITFSAGEKYLYVTSLGREEEGHHALRVALRRHGVERGSFLRHASAPGEDALDHMKVDQRGNLYVSGPGGLWIISAEGKHLGTVIAPKHPRNMAWGDEDGKTLYICARSGLYKMGLNIPGILPFAHTLKAEQRLRISWGVLARNLGPRDQSGSPNRRGRMSTYHNTKEC